MKIAIVTGATGYIGSCIVHTFLENDYIVGCVCRNREKFVMQFPEENAILINADVTDYYHLKDEIDSFCQFYGNVSVLVNCAGGSARKLEKSFKLQTKEVFDKIINLNLLGTIYTTHACVKYLKNGCVINISSYIGVNGQSCASEYAAAKGGVIALTIALAKECSTEGIRVNCISPGYVPRPEEIAEHGEKACLGFTYIGDRIKAQDIANSVLFLGSDKSYYITGQNIVIDGGSSLSLRKISEGTKAEYEYYEDFGKYQYVIYGTGKKALKYVEFLKRRGKYEKVLSFVDSDKTKWGSRFCEKDINAPFCLKNIPDVKVIVATGIEYFGEIRTILKMLDIDEENIINYKKER